MLRCGLAVAIVWTLLLSAAPAQAQWFTGFWSGVHRDYYRNKDWPEQFLRADREAVTVPIGLMVSNGWRRQNLLSDFHFNEDAPQLNQAGELKLQYILTQMSPQRRTVFVQRGASPDITATRMAVVQRTAARILPSGHLADVVESDLPNDGWPAEDADSISRKWQASRPDPRIRSASAAAGGSGGSGSGK